MRHYAYAVVFIMTALVIAHLFADDSYLWHLNSISQLAAQTYEKAWIMRVGFIGFGILIQVAATRRAHMAGRVWFREVPIMIYGLAILLSGFFSAEPFIEGVLYSQQEARIHGVFATTAGIALSTAILLYAITDAPNVRKTGHFIALVLVTLFSLLFGMLSNAAGVMQRLLWLVGFAWLLYLGINVSSGDTLSGTKSSA